MSYRGIPPVRTWKVTAVETGKVIYVDTINKRFARWIANTEFGMWGKTLRISVVKEKGCLYCGNRRHVNSNLCLDCLSGNRMY